MPSIESLIAAHTTGDAESLRALAVALHSRLDDTPDLPSDPAAAMLAVEDRGEQAGTWQEVRAARDYGDLTAEEYEYLAAAMDVLDKEQTDGR